VDAVRRSDVTAELAEHIVNLNGADFIQVHPTFLYESLWNLALFAFLMWFTFHMKKFDGEVFCMYMAGYGIGRFWIEGLRTDQLILFETGIAVSQLVAILMIVSAAVIIIKNRRKKASEVPNNTTEE